MTARIRLDDMTDHGLDQLYDRLVDAEADRDTARDALRHLIRATQDGTEEQHDGRNTPATTRALVDAVAKALPDLDPAEERDLVWSQYRRAHRLLGRRAERAESETANVKAYAKEQLWKAYERADRAEAAVARVRTLAEVWLDAPDPLARAMAADLLSALEGPTSQP